MSSYLALIDALRVAQNTFTQLSEDASNGLDISLDAYSTALDAKMAAHAVLVDALAQIPDELLGLSAYNSVGQHLLLCCSAKEIGKYQLTTLDASGVPWGDTEFQDKKSAIDDLISRCDLDTLTGFAEPERARSNSVRPDLASLPIKHRAPFRTWFRNSKVVDSVGDPLQVFHGTRAEFKKFRMGGSGKTAGTGAFFTSSAAVAATYAGKHGLIMPVYLSFQSPVVVHCRGNNWGKLSGKCIAHLPALPDKSAAKLSLKDLFAGEMVYDDDYASTDDLARWARSEDYESIIFRNVKDHGPDGSLSSDLSYAATDVYVAFAPEQIISATSSIPSAKLLIAGSCELTAERLNQMKSQFAVLTESQQVAMASWILERSFNIDAQAGRKLYGDLVSMYGTDGAIAVLAQEMGGDWISTPFDDAPGVSARFVNTDNQFEMF